MTYFIILGFFIFSICFIKTFMELNPIVKSKSLFILSLIVFFIITMLSARNGDTEGLKLGFLLLVMGVVQFVNNVQIAESLERAKE